jgi:hypothetical protein
LCAHARGRKRGRVGACAGEVIGSSRARKQDGSITGTVGQSSWSSGTPFPASYPAFLVANYCNVRQELI